MLDGTRNPELYAQWLDYIVDPGVKDAFFFIVGVAAESTRYRCHIQWKGDVRDFRFHETPSDEQPHSFTTNQHWLLFYFRPPAVRSGIYSRPELERDFDSFFETPAGEWTVKLRSIDDVRRLSRHMKWRAV